MVRHVKYMDFMIEASPQQMTRLQDSKRGPMGQVVLGIAEFVIYWNTPHSNPDHCPFLRATVVVVHDLVTITIRVEPSY